MGLTYREEDPGWQAPDARVGSHQWQSIDLPTIRHRCELGSLQHAQGAAALREAAPAGVQDVRRRREALSDRPIRRPDDPDNVAQWSPLFSELRIVWR